jgi:hypothetical protein
MVFCCVTQARLKLKILLLLPPKCWDHRYVSPCLALIELFQLCLISIGICLPVNLQCLNAQSMPVLSFNIFLSA